MNKNISYSVELSGSGLFRKVKDVGISKEFRPIPNEKLLPEWEIHESTSTIVDDVTSVFYFGNFGMILQ